MLNITNILGFETTRDVGILILSFMGQTWLQSLTTRDMRILSVALTATLLVIVAQVMWILTNNRQKTSWLGVLLVFIFDILVFGILVVGQIKFAYWMLDVKAPRSIVIERVSPELTSVNWKTYDPEYSMVLWGYEPERLHEIEIGVGDNLKDRRHEVLIESEKNREIYLKILVGEEMYGRNNVRGGEAYGVEGGQ